MKSENWNRLSPIVIDSSLALFESYGVPLQFAAECPQVSIYGQCIAAMIGYTGDIRGSLLFATSLSVVQMSHPINPRLVRDPVADLRDWTGELANQLLGRVRNRLATGGVNVHLTTPLCLVSREVKSVPSKADAVRIYMFHCLGSELFLRLDVDVPDDWTLRLPPPKSAAATAPEGDIMLF